MKFVKGDAIAGIIITAVNIVGGLVIGVMQRGMAIGEARRRRTRSSPSATGWSRRSRRCSSRPPPASS